MNVLVQPKLLKSVSHLEFIGLRKSMGNRRVNCPFATHPEEWKEQLGTNSEVAYIVIVGKMRKCSNCGVDFLEGETPDCIDDDDQVKFIQQTQRLKAIEQ